VGQRALHVIARRRNGAGIEKHHVHV